MCFNSTDFGIIFKILIIGKEQNSVFICPHLRGDKKNRDKVMKFNKIRHLWFDFISLVSRRSYSFKNFILCDTYLTLQDKNLSTNIELNSHLVKAFEKISRFTSIDLDLYGVRKVTPDNWMDLLAKKSQSKFLPASIARIIELFN